MSKLFVRVAWFKTYFNGLASYLGIINFVLLLLTFKSVYSINISAWFIVPTALLVGGLVGWLDYNYIQRPQNEISNAMNDLKFQLNRLEEKLK